MILTKTRFAMVAALLLCWPTLFFAQDATGPATALTHTKFDPLPEGERLLVFISDVHLGLGRGDDGTWHTTEDFRWDHALQGFLDYISAMGQHQVDLVVLGDFLEMWQPPASVRCEGVDADLGCSVEEMQEIATAVVRAHPKALKALRDFSQRGANRLYIVPGNHDSALLLEPVWRPLGAALQVDSGRIGFVTSGVWTSRDGRILAEHGHQIGSDVNRYDAWPTILRADNGRNYVIRPWGERFVQKLFNSEEREYPIIDNLSPESAGARYRMSDRGLWSSIADLGRFILFNLFETSLSQKAYFLGPEPQIKERPTWDLAIARKMGHKLFADALDSNDPFRKTLFDDTEQARALRRELDALAQNPKSLPDDEVRLLCDQVAIRAGKDGPKCETPHLGYMLESNLIPREWVLREHLSLRLGEHPGARVFVYAHTHQLEEGWGLRLTNPFNVEITILNTGAFQRVIDEKGYLRRVNDNGLSAAEGLRKLSPEALPPCYTTVIVPYEDSLPKPVTKRWLMEENGNGTLVDPGDARCG